jgi:hypothetical protein
MIFNLLDPSQQLGVTFSSDGKWTNHINNIIESSMKQINALRNLKYILSSKSLSNIYLYGAPQLQFGFSIMFIRYQSAFKELH